MSEATSSAGLRVSVERAASSRPFRGSDMRGERAAMSTVPNLAVALRYADVATAVAWLERAFGFARQQVAGDDGGAARYAEMTFGNAMILLEAAGDSALAGVMRQPDEVGRAATQTCYLMVHDADTHYAAARAAGAEIVLDIGDYDNGGRGYSCRDPEGHVWTFGTYDPWRRERAVSPPGTAERPRRGRLGRVVAVAALSSALGASALAGAWVDGTYRLSRHLGAFGPRPPDRAVSDAAIRQAEQRGAREGRLRVHEERMAREAAQAEARQAGEALAREREARTRLERVASQAREAERTARRAQEARVLELRAALDRQRIAKEAAETAVRDMEERLAAQRELTDAQLNAVREARDALELANAARRSAEGEAARAREGSAEAARAQAGAEAAARETQEKLEREEQAKRAAWRVITQLRKQLSLAEKALSAAGGAGAVATGSAGPAKARPRPKARSKRRQRRRPPQP